MENQDTQEQYPTPTDIAYMEMLAALLWEPDDDWEPGQDN